MSGRWASSNRKAELPRDWQAIRRRIKHRDPECTWPGCTAPTTDIDHVEDKHDHRDENLRGLCAAHHRQRTKEQAKASHAAAYAKAARPLPKHPGLP